MPESYILLSAGITIIMIFSISNYNNSNNGILV